MLIHHESQGTHLEQAGYTVQSLHLRSTGDSPTTLDATKDVALIQNHSQRSLKSRPRHHHRNAFRWRRKWKRSRRRLVQNRDSSRRTPRRCGTTVLHVRRCHTRGIRFCIVPRAALRRELKLRAQYAVRWIVVKGFTTVLGQRR